MEETPIHNPRQTPSATFYERAARLGHNIEALKAGMSITTSIVANDVEQLRNAILLVSDGDPNANMASMLFAGIPLTDPAEDVSAYGIMRRVNEYLYGGAPLSILDQERIQGIFPVTILATSVETFTPTAPQPFNTPTTPQSFNIGTLTLNQGIYYAFYNTVVTSFTVDNIVRNGNSGNASLGDFNFLGATGTSTGTGSTGATGTAGGAGSGGTCTGGGGISGDDGGRGGTGNTGGTGGPGGQGGNGLPTMNAAFTLTTSLTGTNPQLVFLTRSGTGGAGGVGGRGGTGGAGGAGGHGATCACEHTNGGNGGNGGTGGTGGQGGTGGNGVNAQGNVVVTIPASLSNSVIALPPYNAPAGVYGAGGAPGTGGPGGGGGGGGGASGCPNGSGGSNGSAGGQGSQGLNGANGSEEGTSNPITVITT